MKSLSEIGNYVINYLLTTGPSVLLAIATLFAGLYIIRKTTRFIENKILKRNIEASLAYFMSSFLRFILVGLLLITVASMLGIATSSFVAVLGAAGLAVGLALQGSLSNFAGGMIILFFKPFKVGEYITTDGKEGFVEQIDILNTT
ncbi:MAG TPA: mechanosensitive ion channel domain-containing protein, partial [Chitinophaga sp.]|uniref:mechanosensitive ion channel family protein n=1 Tax=Chitinophaga sp. TaxID=1869181 RepID=UPI002CD6F2EA